MSAVYKDDQDDWLTVCLKYLLFVFNFLFWYFFCLLLIFLIELVAGVLAYVYYQRLSEELKQHLNQTMTENYAQPGKEAITLAVDKLQQDFKCCGSNNSHDWTVSVYISSNQAEGRVVPDSCCKTITPRCGKRDHPSNIYKVEGGCITKLEQFLADHLLVIGAVGIGVACLQLTGAALTACFIYLLYKEEEEDFDLWDGVHLLLVQKDRDGPLLSTPGPHTPPSTGRWNNNLLKPNFTLNFEV